MSPKIINVQEGRAVSPAGTTMTVINIQYTVGSFGPFTLVTNAAEISNGQAAQKMNAFAASLGTLPVA